MRTAMGTTPTNYKLRKAAAVAYACVIALICSSINATISEALYKQHRVRAL